MKKCNTSSWLPSFIDIDPFSQEKYEKLYCEYIKIQENRPKYKGVQIYIPFNKDKIDSTKQEMFFHLTTKDYTSNKRKEKNHEQFDFERAKRLDWICAVIENCHEKSVLIFEHSEKEYLFLPNERYVVILAKSKKYTNNFKQYQLVTAFYINEEWSLKKMQNRYEKYIKTVNAER